MSVQVDIATDEVIQVNLVEDEVVSAEVGKGITVSKDGSKVATTRWIDFEAGSNVTLAIVDQGNKVKVTISSSSGSGSGSGTVSSFSAGDLSPLFTSSVAGATTTPALTFAQVNQNANVVFAGPSTGVAAAPTFRSLVAADIPTLPYIATAGNSALTAATTIQSAGETLTFDINQSALVLNGVVNGETITFDDLAPGGLRYGADYSADYDARSLTDKGYVDTGLGAKQDTLVSGTNIKTINSTSLLGSGDISITASSAFSSLTAATGTNTINNASYAQEWQWDTLGAGIGLTLSSSATDAASNTQTVLRVNQDGANGTSTQTTTAVHIRNTKTGTTSTNRGLVIESSGGTTNDALEIIAGNTRVRQVSGTSSDSHKLIFEGRNASSTLFTQEIFADFNGASLEQGINIGPGLQVYNGRIQTTGSGSGTHDFRGGSTFRNSGTLAVYFSISGGGTQNTSAVPTLFGTTGTITSNTQVDIRGTGTGTNKAFRVATSANTEVLYIQDNGGIVNNSQIGHLIGGTTITTNALLDLQSTTKAFIPPRMTEAQRDAIGTPSIGMIVYNTDTNLLNFHNGSAWGAI